VNCDEFVELVTAYLDGQLDPDTEHRFRDHLAQCDGCDRYLEQIRRTVDLLGALPPELLTGPGRDTLLTAFRDWRAG
jgi:anti-sigma factor RsiW